MADAVKLCTDKAGVRWSTEDNVRHNEYIASGSRLALAYLDRQQLKSSMPVDLNRVRPSDIARDLANASAREMSLDVCFRSWVELVVFCDLYHDHETGKPSETQAVLGHGFMHNVLYDFDLLTDPMPLDAILCIYGSDKDRSDAAVSIIAQWKRIRRLPPPPYAP